MGCFKNSPKIELNLEIEEIAGYAGFDGSLRNQSLIFTKAPSVHQFFGLLNISNQINCQRVLFFQLPIFKVRKAGWI